MKSDHFEFEKLDSTFLTKYYSNRMGETRIGDVIQRDTSNNTKFCVLGIEESLGPQANGGFSGAENAFSTFLRYFLKMQANRFIAANNICLLGRVRLNSGVVKLSTNDHVAALDEFVFEVLKQHLPEDTILVVVGGGHNNAYPILKSFASRNKRISVLNVDPHADCRDLEGRHSGNPFSYALSEKIARSYAVVGLHKAYNNESTLKFLDDHSCYYSFFEDRILNMPSEFDHVINKWKAEQFVGIELDMDSISNSPSSAFTPSGLRFEEARYFISQSAGQLAPLYLHLPEAAPKNEYEERVSGKMLAYLVYDFVTNHKSSKEFS
jgi:formiminoglutamase